MRPVMTLISLLGLAAPALAEAPGFVSESPRRFAVELKFAPYIPAIDSSAGLADQRVGGRVPTPFSDLFGDLDARVGAPPSRHLLTLAEIDYQFLNRFGSLGVGLQLGYFRKSARQPIYFTNATNGTLAACSVTYRKGDMGEDLVDAPRVYEYPKDIDPKEAVKNPNSPDECFSSDDNILNILPLSALLVYRFDYLDQRFRVPIIPYMKIGLGYYIWWMGTSGELVTGARVDPAGRPIPPEQQQAASGASAGLLLQPGVAFDLGAIDRQVARTLDTETGVNRVTLFIELNYAWMNHFGYANKLDLSDLTFNAGLGFEF